jgi:protein tyrosine/serine phosphatase
MLKNLRNLRNYPVNSYPSQLTYFLLFIVVLATGCTNFHEVTPNILYRSKQLSGSQFDHFIKKYKIKTVINLRGASPNAKWYQGEMNMIQKDTVSHLDIGLSAIQYVPAQKVDSIMSIAAAAAKPILVHCQGGADRSGLFCAAWKLKFEKVPEEKASKQLSFIYGHIPFFIWNRTEAMDSSFRDYVRFLGYSKIRKQ